MICMCICIITVTYLNIPFIFLSNFRLFPCIIQYIISAIRIMRTICNDFCYRTMAINSLINRPQLKQRTERRCCPMIFLNIFAEKNLYSINHDLMFPFIHSSPRVPHEPGARNFPYCSDLKGPKTLLQSSYIVHLSRQFLHGTIQRHFGNRHSLW